MSARTKRQAVIHLPLPVAVPPRLGPVIIPAEVLEDGTVRFSLLRGETGTYRLIQPWGRQPYMERQE